MGFIKRFIPFLAAFAVGVFITSFFVDLSRPRFNFRAYRGQKFRYCERMQVENQELRAENERLRSELHRLGRDEGIKYEVTPAFPGPADIPSAVTVPLPAAPPPPPAPKAHR